MGSAGVSARRATVLSLAILLADCGSVSMPSGPHSSPITPSTPPTITDLRWSTPLPTSGDPPLLSHGRLSMPVTGGAVGSMGRRCRRATG